MTTRNTEPFLSPVCHNRSNSKVRKKSRKHISLGQAEAFYLFCLVHTDMEGFYFATYRKTCSLVDIILLQHKITFRQYYNLNTLFIFIIIIIFSPSHITVHHQRRCLFLKWTQAALLGSTPKVFKIMKELAVSCQRWVKLDVGKTVYCIYCCTVCQTPVYSKPTCTNTQLTVQYTSLV